MFKHQSPSKYSPLDAIHLSRCFFHCSKQFLNSSVLMPFSAPDIFCFTSSSSAKRFTLRIFFIQRNKTKSLGVRSGEQGGWVCCNQSRSSRSTLASRRWKKMCRAVGILDMPLFTGGWATRAASCVPICMFHVVAPAPQHGTRRGTCILVCLSLSSPPAGSPNLFKYERRTKLARCQKLYNITILCMRAPFMLWKQCIGPSLKAMRTLVIRPFQGYGNTAFTWVRKPDCLHLPYNGAQGSCSFWSKTAEPSAWCGQVHS